MQLDTSRNFSIKLDIKYHIKISKNDVFDIWYLIIVNINIKYSLIRE